MSKTSKTTIHSSTLSPWVQTEEPLLWLRGVGHEVRHSQKDYYFDSLKRKDHPHWTLQMTLSGCGWFERGGKEFLLKSGMAFLSEIPDDFRYGYPPDNYKLTEPYELIFMTFIGKASSEWCRRIVHEFGHVLDFGASNVIASQMRSLVPKKHAEISGLSYREHFKIEDRYLLSGRIYQLMMMMLSSLNRARTQMTPLVTESLRLIGEHASDPAFNVKTLAIELGCSREHLTRCFQANQNVSPLNYLTQHRLKLAAEGLRHTTDKLDQVSAQSGFSSANYFCRVFRQHHGITPAQARQRPWLLG